MCRPGMVMAAGLLVSACGGGPLDPTTTADGLTFFGEAEFVAAEDPFIMARLRVRNDAIIRIERTFLGGCFIQRMQLFERGGEDLTPVWDSDDRTEPHGCTDDLALVDLRPGETVAPANWRFGATLAELHEASVPSGTYAIAVWFRLDDEELGRVGVGEVTLPASLP